MSIIQETRTCYNIYIYLYIYSKYWLINCTIVTHPKFIRICRTITNIHSDSVKTLAHRMSSLGLTPDADSGSGESETNGRSSGYSTRIARSTRIQSADNRLHGVQKQTITRRRTTSTTGTLSKADIQRIYLNKKLGRMKVTNLETIFEENDTNVNNCAVTVGSNAIVFGSRKVKRSLSCSDGFSPSRTLKEKRKKRAKSVFGAVKHYKNMSKAAFFNRMATYDSNNGTDVMDERSYPLVTDNDADSNIEESSESDCVSRSAE